MSARLYDCQWIEIRSPACLQGLEGLPVPPGRYRLYQYAQEKAGSAASRQSFLDYWWELELPGSNGDFIRVRATLQELFGQPTEPMSAG
ncbi:hypothetical protein [Indioceanicola profundi]|uniref:hypothetical protein n=1 Tax=Indioceanicola profundi TaxID=2220096 RepID=UPI000E6AC852|nr:hypothetical protein [Indioceanicola profundi]